MKKKWIVINPSPHWKFLLVMKTMFLFFLLTTFTAFSEISYSQVTRISLNLQNVSVKEVLKTIEDQTEFIFFYQDQEIDLNRIVSITVINLPVNEILDRIFAGTENFYTVRDRQIIIARNKNKLAGEAGSIRPIFSQSRQGHAVTGKVTDRTSGEALPGVNIVVEGSTIGTITNTEGWYQITVPSPSSILIFSYVGYTPHREKVNNRTQIDVVLEPSVEQLDEVVTVGYGVQKKVNLSGAVDVVASKNIEDRPVNNVVQALQGLAPNLNILVGNEGGEVGGKMILNVRGIGSINGAGGSPYILVDGIEQSIYNINPNDIESISVLKDAAASAIYGARGAFGVILVTTKKGKSDGVIVNYSNNYSYSTPLHLPKMVNSIQFAEYLNLAAANDGAQPIFQPIIIDQMKKYQAGEIKDWTMPVPWAPNYWLEYTGGWANTDWFKIDYKKWVPKSSHNFSLSGGDKRIQFFLSGATFSQEGLLRFGNDQFSRDNFNAKINVNVYDWLRLNFMSKYNRTNLDRPSYNKDQFYANIARRWPTNGVYLPDGNLWPGGEQNWLQNGGRYKEETNELSLVPGIEIEPLSGWIIYANYRWKFDADGFSNHEAKVYGTFVDGTKFALRPNNFFEVNQGHGYYNSPNIYSSYHKLLGKHDFTILAGFEQELYTLESNYSRKDNLISDKLPSLGTATGKEYASGSRIHWATRSFFGRLNYAFADKYLIELSGRRDGSSRFPRGRRWGIFPSGSLSWILSRENFWESLSKYVSYAKIRASYGALGNQDIENYLFVERLPIYSNPPLPYIIGNERPTYVGMAPLNSPSLTWEKVNTTNTGFDLGFLNNKLNISFDYFMRFTYNMLGPVESLPSVLGTAVPRSNNATLRTNGFELMISWKQTVSGFRYELTGMLSNAKTVILEYNNPQYLLSAPYYKGKVLGEIWGYTTLGFFQSDEEAQNWDQSYITPEPWTAGDIKYADLNKDGKIDPGKNTLKDHGDLSIIGNSTPQYLYSFLANAGWKGFDLSMIWQGVGKRDLWLNSPHFWGVGWIWTSVAFKEHMNYWTENNRNAYFPKPRMDKAFRNRQVQTRYLQNGAYLRLKSLQLGYTFPAKISQRVFVKSFKIFCAGENLLTITKLIKTFDPETTGGAYGNGFIYPLQKTWSFGVNLTF